MEQWSRLFRTGSYSISMSIPSIRARLWRNREGMHRSWSMVTRCFMMVDYGQGGET